MRKSPSGVTIVLDFASVAHSIWQKESDSAQAIWAGRLAIVLFCASLAMTLMVGAFQSYVVSRYMGWRFVDRRLHQCSHHHQPTSEGLKMTGAQYRAARNHVNEKMPGISGRGLLPRPGSVGSFPECISYRHGRLDGDPEEDFSDDKDSTESDFTV